MTFLELKDYHPLPWNLKSLLDGTRRIIVTDRTGRDIFGPVEWPNAFIALSISFCKDLKVKGYEIYGQHR